MACEQEAASWNEYEWQGYDNWEGDYGQGWSVDQMSWEEGGWDDGQNYEGYHLEELSLCCLTEEKHDNNGEREMLILHQGRIDLTRCMSRGKLTDIK